MSRLLNSMGLFVLMFSSMGFYDYPSTKLDHDPDFKYWVYKNKVKKITCSPKKFRDHFDYNYSTEYSFSETGELIEERYYIEYIGNVSIYDTVALTNDGHIFYDTLGISHKRYFLEGDVIRKIQLIDTSGNLVFSFYKDDEDDFDFFRSKMLVKSIKYIDDKRDLEIMSFGFMRNYAPYFDTLSSVKLVNDPKTNVISVSAWVKDPREQDWYDTELRKEYYTEKRRRDTLFGTAVFDLNNKFYNEKLISLFGKNYKNVFESCIVSKYFDSNPHWFSRSHEYYDDIEYSIGYAFSEERRFIFNEIYPDSTLVLHYGYPQIEAETYNEKGKIIRYYSIYGPISSNPPELIQVDQYNLKNELIESYGLWRNGWHKNKYEYDDGYLIKQAHFRQVPDSTIDSTSYTRKNVYDYYGNLNYYMDIHFNRSNSDQPQLLNYLHVSSADYFHESRITFVGNTRDTITNFIVADSSNRVYTVEYW